MVSNLSSPNIEALAPRPADKRLLAGLACLGLCAALSMAAESGAHAQPPKACDSRAPCAVPNQPRLSHRLPSAEEASLHKALERIWYVEKEGEVFIHAVTTGDQAYAAQTLAKHGFGNAGQYQYSLENNPLQPPDVANCRVTNSGDFKVTGNNINFILDRNCSR